MKKLERTEEPVVRARSTSQDDLLKIRPRLQNIRLQWRLWEATHEHSTLQTEFRDARLEASDELCSATRERQKMEAALHGRDSVQLPSLLGSRLLQRFPELSKSWKAVD